MNLKYHHIGIPTDKPRPGEVYLPAYKPYHQVYETSAFGIKWMRYDDACPIPELVKTLPHIAFEADDIYGAIRGKHVIIAPNSPSPGYVVAFIEETGVPIELIQIDSSGETAPLPARQSFSPNQSCDHADPVTAAAVWGLFLSRMHNFSVRPVL